MRASDVRAMAGPLFLTSIWIRVTSQVATTRTGASRAPYLMALCTRFPSNCCGRWPSQTPYESPITSSSIRLSGWMACNSSTSSASTSARSIFAGARSRNAAASIYAAAGKREAASASHCARTRMRDRFIPGDVALRRPDSPSRLGERLPSDRGVPQGRGPRSACVEPGLAA